MTYRVSFQELRQFEEDLHRHVHLENNILFPKSIVMEEELMSLLNPANG
jgi:regulator of cell morphogenesis and NO signaling